ncbi:alpha-amylase [Pedobacter nyackensis]|uniref:alpha-amylase n=1 Tax=Pedobacter nyackensis TaxID=475255 RepID=UPI002930E19A|nr:alpha-amylase [Pedobacter nyackensis]
MDNQTLLQYFHWYYNDEDKLWIKAKKDVASLAEVGITAVWLPPAYKAESGAASVGYDPYDLFDLGEFDQKDTIETRFGSKDEYLEVIKIFQENGIAAIADVVLNHKAGGDELEKVAVRSVDPENRLEFISDIFEIEAWTRFTFPGRNGEYSGFIWDKSCFSGVDWAEDIKEMGIYSIQNEYGEGWEEVPSTELGNYDYLMFNDIEFRNPSVRAELKYWGEWYYHTCGMKGFRLDAVKHISTDFLIDWIDHMKKACGQDFFIVAENWNIDSLEHLQDYLDVTEGRMQLFDSLLHHNLFLASTIKRYDLTTIFDNTLVQTHPLLTVTFVDNHDSQPLQALESYVDFWFRPLAYALILLREQGMPCVFYPDLYGAKYTDKTDEGYETGVELVALHVLPKMIGIRKDLAYGAQRDYLDFPNCIGWTREGRKEKPQSGIAVLMSNGDIGLKLMEIGLIHAGKKMVDALGGRKEEVLVDEKGWAEFYCNAGSVSVWVFSV